MQTISSHEFSYDKESKTFSAFYSDMMKLQSVFQMKSAKTGAVAVFRREKAVYTEDGIDHWLFRPDCFELQAIGVTLKLWND